MLNGRGHNRTERVGQTQGVERIGGQGGGPLCTAAPQLPIDVVEALATALAKALVRDYQRDIDARVSSSPGKSMTLASAPRKLSTPSALSFPKTTR